MTDAFLTEGLREDRYLKAIRLITQFENEIDATFEEFDQEMVDAQPALFDRSTSPSLKTNRTPGSGLAIHRINHAMTGPQAPDDKTQRLNVHLYWMPPTEYGRTDIDGALRAFGYKVKGADRAIDDRIAEQTREEEWSIRTSENPYDSNIVFYRHVDSLADIEEARETLVSHFTTFGDEYASD